jgi:RNA polymerase sigma factor (sigma-70 family)
VDDATLARAIVAGDRRAFRLLFDRESPMVLRPCQRVLGRLPDAEDAVQATFLIAYRSMATWRGEGTLGAWLGRIASREAVRRAKAVKGPVQVDTASEEVEAVPSSADPAADAVSAEEQRLVRGAMERLPEPYREVVILRFFSDLALADIAATTGRPLGTVKVQLHRGLERLRRDLERKGGRA